MVPVLFTQHHDDRVSSEQCRQVDQRIHMFKKNCSMGDRLFSERIRYLWLEFFCNIYGKQFTMKNTKSLLQKNVPMTTWPTLVIKYMQQRAKYVYIDATM